MSDHCGECFPVAPELARLAENAQAGRREPFVGTGDPDTVLACAHGEWRLGDVTAEPKPSCQAVTKAGDPCKGTPGEDGLCAAHKPKGDADAGGPAGADPAQEEGGSGEGEEAEAQDDGSEAPGAEEAGGEAPGPQVGEGGAPAEGSQP